MMTNLLSSSVARLRFLLVILVTICVSAEVWGETWTRVTTMEQLTSGGTFIMGYEATAKSGTIVPLRSADCNATTSANGYFHTGTTANKSTSSTITMSSVVNTSAYEVYISSPASGKINIQRATSTGNYYGASSGGTSKNTARLYTEGNTTETNLIVEWASEANNQFKLKTEVSGTYKYLKYNTGSPRFAFYDSAGEKIVFYKKSAPSYTITATSNNNTYGTVSVSGTTITASPNIGYTYANPAYTVTSGTATVIQNGNIFTVTPSSDCSIQINFAEKVKNTYIDNVQGNSIQTLYDTHAVPSLTDKTQATTGTCEQQHWHFMGWVTEANKENPTDENISEPSTNTIANGTTYYAVWAKGTTTGGGSTSKQYSFDITPSNFNNTSYDANNNEKTSTAKASDGSTLSVKWTSNQVMLQSSAMQWQKSAGYIYNSTDLGTINSITVTKSEGTFTTYYGTSKQPSSSTTIGNGYFQIKVGSATGKTSKVTITFTKTTQGAQTTTYSDYITTCTTQPSYSVTYNGNGHTSGSVPTDDTEYEKDAQVTVLGNTGNLAKSGYTFSGWNTEADGNGTDYAAGNYFTITKNTTLYAKWTAKTATSLTWSPTSYSATIDADNTFPKLTISPEAIKEFVQYTSSDETVATISADGQTLTLLKAGTTTITATFTETNTHAGSTASYTLTVHPSNCRWVEVTDNTTLEEGDLVVIAMTKAGVTYALPNEGNTSSAPYATLVDNIVGDIIANVPDLLKWEVEKSENNYIFHPADNGTLNLYCNKDDDGVRVGSSNNAQANQVFSVSGNYLLNNATRRYLGVSLNTTPYSWRCYTGTTGVIKDQTLKFYKRECLDASKVWVEGNFTNVTCYTQLPQRLAKNGSLELTFIAADGYVLPNDVTVSNATKTWNKEDGTLTISNPTNNVTVTVEAVKLHTITWMVGSNSVRTDKVANATGVTQTPDDPANDAIGNCADAFVGWSEKSAGSTPQDKAYYDDLCTAADMQSKHSNVTGDKTFYAVFASAEGGNDYVQISSENDLVAGSKYLIVGNSSTTYKALPVDKATNLTQVSPSSSKISNPTDELIWTLEGTADQWKIKSTSNNKYLQISAGNLTFEESTALTFAVTVSSSKFTFTSSAASGNKVLSYYHNGNPSRFNAYTTANNVYIYKQDIDYSNYVTNCCATPAPTNGTFNNVTGSGNAMSLTLNWEGSAARYHITGGNLAAEGVYTSATSYTVNNLIECEEYTFNITAYPEDGCESAAIQISAQPFSGAKTVNYNYNGGSGSTASFTTSCENQKIFLPNATRPGYTFNGWFDAESGGNHVGAAGAEYNPATSPITLYAQWTETNYTLTHNGSNYTNTENKTSIKSSETPFTLHYTCTGDYGLPATISITGGGKSWTVDTDYTWAVAVDKQSATLTINQTTITADVTITINVATRYTVTFIHNDKGIFDGSETLEVLSTENTITLPNITNVSCGFYDTFEGWIVANEDYTESTSKPAGTIYTGGANYTVTGDCTLRALYSKCEGDATQVYAKVTTIDEVTDGTYILVSNNTTPRTYSGHTNTNNYGNCIDGLDSDGNYYSKTLPKGAVTLTVTRGTGNNASRFTIQNGTKYFKAGSDIALQDDVSWWQLTTGEEVNSKNCPAGALNPVNAKTYVMQEYQSNRFKTYENTQPYYVFLYKLIDKCTKYYSTNPSCEKPVGVHIVYHANAVNASMSCSTQDRTYKVENEVNKYPQLASQLQFCTNATREGYTLVGWNTQENGQGKTYNINQNYYTLPVSGELDGEKWITLNLYAMWKPCITFNLGNAIGGTGVPDAVVENDECVLPTPTAEQLGTIPCGYEFYAWSETSVQPTQTKPALFMAGDTYSGDASTLHAVYRLCEVGSNPDLFSLSYTISDTKYYVGPVTKNQEGYNVKFTAITDANNATVFGMKSIEGKTYKSLFWVDSEGNNKYMYWKDYSASFQFTSEEDKSYGWNISGTTELTFVSTQYMDKGFRYLSADASEIGCPSTPKAVKQFTKEMASTMICTYATEPECSTTATLQFVTNGGTLNYPTTYDANSYQNLTPGTTVYLPTATFAGEWTFEGWMKDEPLTSQNLKPETVNFIEVELNITTYSASKTGTTIFYAVYSKTKDDKQFDPVNGGTYKLFAIGAVGTKTYMPIWDGSLGTMSGVTTCAEAGDYTITPGTDTHAGQYQITCGEHILGVVGDVDQTDLNEVEGTWWNINPSISGKGTWRITVVGSSNRALSALSKSFGNYSLTQINNAGQPTYRDMEIGECIYTEYTSTPENIPYITITGAPVKITSANGERVYASTTVHIEAHNFTGERIIHLSATNGFGVDPEQVRTNGQGAYSGNVKVYYEPTTDGDGQTITTSVLTASQRDGTNAEKINQTFAAIQGRNMPTNFVIAAKWDGHWYALPANCTSSLSSTEGLLIEVDDVDNPTVATAAPAFSKYGLREVIRSRQTGYGQGIVFTERFAEGDKQFALYNGSDANIQVNAQYVNYAQTNPDKYEWIPSTSDFKDYTLTNASTGRNLGLTSGTFGAYIAASNQVRLLPATFYEPATAQVLKWKANSVIVMYTGAEATATTQVGDNAQSTEQTLAAQKLTHGIYELTTNQALTSNAGGTLSLYFGANTRVELEIPLIISGEVTASANAHDVVILEHSKLTAAATKYSYKDVYVYGGAKLAIPENTELGVNNIILRAGAISTNGAGQEATYQYIYPQVELKGTLTSSVQNIRYEYVTDYDHWYHLVLPFDGSLTSIHYPYEYYGDQVKLDNTGSWQIKRYAGEIRATGNYNAWKDIEKDEPKATTVTAGKGYIFWGAPKKVSVNGGASTRQKWGIQRITMSVTAPNAMTAENGDKAITGLSSHKDVPNNSGAANDQGWNLIGNPYMVNLTTMSEDGLRAGKLVKEMVDDKWTGKWINNGENLRYLTIPSEHFDTYEAKTVSEAINANAFVPGRAFFVQLEGEANGITFAATNRASLMPALLAENNDKPVDIETGIVLSNETLQDEVNFWIKDGKTNDYEYNADYPKTPNNNRFNIYGVHTNGDLSWVAISPELAAESMPIGYQVPAAGTYMLSLSETYYSEDLESLYLTDHAMSPELIVDLINAPYEFSVNQAETNNERFTISLKLKSENQGPTTGWENIDVGKDHPIKFIHQDRLYILRDGVIYDATGQEIQTINK